MLQVESEKDSVYADKPSVNSRRHEEDFMLLKMSCTQMNKIKHLTCVGTLYIIERQRH